MLLKKGSSGEEVKQLQEKLGLTTDGSFGPGTEAKVIEWQSANGLTPDGIVGDVTWSKMFSDQSQISTSNFKLDNLKGHIPDSVILQIPDTAIKFGITNVLRLTHFLAQCSHESCGFTAVKENLNYSSDGLKKIFGKYFPGNLSESYNRLPEKIADRVYANRMGNGNESSGDGYRYRGRGYIQLTGKINYDAFGKSIGVDILSNPDLVATQYPMMSAAFFFTNKGIWEVCDRGPGVDVITKVTEMVNGGQIGLDDRINNFNKYYALLS